MVAGDERLSFADVDRISDRVAHGLVARGIAKGDRVGIAMRNCPSWILVYMGDLEGGRDRDPAQRLVGTRRDGARDTAHRAETDCGRHARARRISEKCSDFETLPIAIDLPAEQALAELLGSDDGVLPEIGPEDDATILFTSGSTGLAKGALSTHRAVTTGTYAYSIGLIVLLGILDRGRSRTGDARRGPWSVCLVPCHRRSSGDAQQLRHRALHGADAEMGCRRGAEAIEKERITYFVGVPTMSLELMNHPDRHNYDLCSLKDITAGGAPRPVSHVKRLGRSSRRPAGTGYGLTETNAVGCINFWSSYAENRHRRPRCEAAGRGRDPRRRRSSLCPLPDSAKSPSEPRRTSIAIGAIPRRPTHFH